MSAAPRQDGRSRPTPPYATIEWRELLRLGELMDIPTEEKAPTLTNVLAALVVLRLRKNVGTGDTRDGLKSLAGRAHVSVSSMRRSVKWLVEQKIVVERRLHDPVKGGTRGVAWAWPRIVLPFEAWGQGEEALTQNTSSVPTRLAQLQGGRPTFEEIRRRKATFGGL